MAACFADKKKPPPGRSDYSRTAVRHGQKAASFVGLSKGWLPTVATRAPAGQWPGSMIVIFS